MRFDRHLPTSQLMPYIREYVVSENEQGSEYKVFPFQALVIGFQYRGLLSTVTEGTENRLEASGITGMTDVYRTFKNTAGIGTILVYFTEIGFTHFTTCPAHELYNQSLSLRDIFAPQSIRDVEEKLAGAATDAERIQTVEHFLLSHFRDAGGDRLVGEAVRLIKESKGAIRIRDLNKQLHISQSPLEKRFRSVVGTSPKKFASIVRFNELIEHLSHEVSLTDIAYQHGFFDQAHFIKSFRQFTGESPEQFRRSR